ncbi:MAG: hypothetical protein HQL54_01825 [Magnetococcales bacterium]|nr:hypothetical protein [Magnetococcales bacterium]
MGLLASYLITGLSALWIITILVISYYSGLAVFSNVEGFLAALALPDFLATPLQHQAEAPIIRTLSGVVGALVTFFLLGYVFQAFLDALRVTLVRYLLRKNELDDRFKNPQDPISAFNWWYFPRFSRLWRDFAKTVHVQIYNDDYGDARVNYRATVPCEMFFNRQTLVDEPMRVEFFRHLPGILTGAGIVSTFAGILLGLTEFNPTVQPDQVTIQLHNLFTGVSTAFVASFMAIFTAILVTVLEKLVLHWRASQINNLQSQIDSLFPGAVESEYLADLVRQETVGSSGEMDHATAVVLPRLEKFLETDFTKVIKDVSERMMVGQAERNRQLETSFTVALNTMTEVLSQSLDLHKKQSQTLSGVETVLTRQDHEVSNALTTLTDQLKLLTAQQQQMGERLAYTSDMLASSEQSVQSGVEIQSGLNRDDHLGAFRSLETRMEKLNTTLESVFLQLDESLGLMHKGIENGQSSMQNELSRHFDVSTPADGEQQSLDNVAGKLGRLIQQNQNLSTSLDTIRQSMDQQHENQQQRGSLDQQANEALGAILTALERLGTLQEHSGDSLKDVSEALIAQQQERQRLVDVLTELTSGQQLTTDQLKQALVVLEKQSNLLASGDVWAEKAANGLAALRELLEKQHLVTPPDSHEIQPVDTVLDAVHAHGAAIDQKVAGLEQVIRSRAAVSDEQLEAIQERIGDQENKLGQSTEDIRNAFVEQTQAGSAQLEQMIQGIKTQQAMMENNLVRLESALSEQLGSTHSLVVESRDALARDLNQLEEVTQQTNQSSADTHQMIHEVRQALDGHAEKLHERGEKNVALMVENRRAIEDLVGENRSHGQSVVEQLSALKEPVDKGLAQLMTVAEKNDQWQKKMVETMDEHALALLEQSDKNNTAIASVSEQVSAQDETLDNGFATVRQALHVAEDGRPELDPEGLKALRVMPEWLAGVQSDLDALSVRVLNGLEGVEGVVRREGQLLEEQLRALVTDLDSGNRDHRRTTANTLKQKVEGIASRQGDLSQRFDAIQTVFQENMERLDQTLEGATRQLLDRLLDHGEFLVNQSEEVQTKALSNLEDRLSGDISATRRYLEEMRESRSKSEKARHQEVVARLDIQENQITEHIKSMLFKGIQDSSDKVADHLKETSDSQNKRSQAIADMLLSAMVNKVESTFGNLNDDLKGLAERFSDEQKGVQKALEAWAENLARSNHQEAEILAQQIRDIMNQTDQRHDGLVDMLSQVSNNLSSNLDQLKDGIITQSDASSDKLARHMEDLVTSSGREQAVFIEMLGERLNTLRKRLKVK